MLKRIRLSIVALISSLICFLPSMGLSSNGLSIYAHNDNNVHNIEIIECGASLMFLESEQILVFDNKSIAIPSFDYYRVLDNHGNLRYYIADTLENAGEGNLFVHISLYAPSRNQRESMNAQYLEKKSMKYYNLSVNISSDYLAFVDQISSDIVLGSDQLSERLKESKKALSLLQKQMSTNGINENQNAVGIQSIATAPMSSNSNYDSYTDSDGILEGYTRFYFNTGNKNGLAIDDPITRLVPKELFFTYGEHFYIGKEYGFFIKTADEPGIYGQLFSDVFVFDITYSQESNVTEYTTNVVPLFNYRYSCFQREYEPLWNLDFDPSLDKVVTPHPNYDLYDYYLRDVSFRHDLRNINALNYGESGYNPYNDTGEFIVQTRYNFSAKSPKREGSNSSVAMSTITFALGFVPYVGNVINISQYAVDLYAQASSYGGIDGKRYSYYQNRNNEANINTCYTVWDEQLNYYGQYLRTVHVAALSTNNENVALIGVGGYAQSIYVTSRKQTTIVHSNHISTIYARVCIDETSRYLGFIPSGEVINYASTQNVYNRTSSILLTVIPNCSIPVTIGRKGFAIIEVNLLAGKTYSFETYDGFDTYLHLFNSSGIQIAYNDDVDGDVFSRITFYSATAQKVYLKLRGYGAYDYGTTMVTIKS